MPRTTLLAVSCLLASTTLCASELCTRWSEPLELGQLDIGLLPEASGIGLSGTGERLYHINDGNEPAFLISDARGGAARRIAVEGFEAADVEDLAVGPCAKRSCLFLADVGDNAMRRPSVRIAIIEEQAQYGDKVTPLAVVTVRYPDGPQNAEAVAVHPSGDLYVVTKSGSGAGRSGPARVYRLGAAQLVAGEEQVFEARGEIPIPALAGTGLAPRRVVTAMDIAPDGTRLVLLTYDSLIEMAIDLTRPLPASDAWAEGRTHRAAPLAPLLQAESIAYDRDGRSVLYTTESIRGSPAPLVRQACAQ